MILIGCSGTRLNHVCSDRENFFEWCNSKGLEVINNNLVGYVLPDMNARELSDEIAEGIQEMASKFYKHTQVTARIIGVSND